MSVLVRKRQVEVISDMGGVPSQKAGNPEEGVSLGKEIIIQLGFGGWVPGLLCSLQVYPGGDGLSPRWLPGDFDEGIETTSVRRAGPMKLLVGRQRRGNEWGAWGSSADLRTVERMGPTELQQC